MSLAGHSKRVDTIRWHPTASGVIASGSTDGTVKLWGKKEPLLTTFVCDTLTLNIILIC